MILSDFLSQQKNNDSDPSEIILISFNAYRVLEENRKIDVCKNEERFLMQTCSQAKTGSTKLLKVHGVNKELNPYLRPEKQHAMPKKGMTERMHIGQGRAGMRRKHDPDHIDQPSDVTRKISERSKIATGKTSIPQHTNTVCDRGINNDKPFPPDVFLHPDPLPKPLLKQQNVDKVISTNQNMVLIYILKKNSQEGIISETIQRLDKPFLQNLKRLEDIIDMGNLIHKFLPRQTHIDKILHIIQRKVLKGTHLPVEIKEIQAGYLHCLYFKEIYRYLSQNKLPYSKLAIKKLEALSERYILLDSLLFRIYPDKGTAVLAIPVACTDMIITLYHKSLIAGHQGVIKT